MIDMDKIKPQIKELAEKYGLKLVMLLVRRPVERLTKKVMLILLLRQTNT